MAYSRPTPAPIRGIAVGYAAVAGPGGGGRGLRGIGRHIAEQLPLIVRFLPSSWADPTTRYLPSTLGQTITRTRVDPTAVAPWPAFALFCGYTAIVLAAAAISLRRRDT